MYSEYAPIYTQLRRSANNTHGGARLEESQTYATERSATDSNVLCEASLGFLLLLEMVGDPGNHSLGAHLSTVGVGNLAVKGVDLGTQGCSRRHRVWAGGAGRRVSGVWRRRSEKKNFGVSLSK